MKRTDRIVELVEGPTVLDLGAVQHDAANAAGGDWLHGRLCEHFERVIGVDYLAGAVAELNAKGYEMVQADVTDMSLDVTADTVVLGELIEHVGNPGLMLDRVGEHCKPGARVVLSTPNPWGLAYMRRMLTGAGHVNDEHVAWYGPRVLRSLLGRHGFAVERIECLRCTDDRLTWLAERVGATTLAGTTWIVTARWSP